MITNSEAEIINKLLDLTAKEHNKMWFLSSELVYIAPEVSPPDLRETIKDLVSPIRDAFSNFLFIFSEIIFSSEGFI